MVEGLNLHIFRIFIGKGRFDGHAAILTACFRFCFCNIGIAGVW